MLRIRILRAACWPVSPGAGLSLASKFLRQTEADRLLRIAAGGEVPTGGSSANANAESTVDPGA